MKAKTNALLIAVVLVGLVATWWAIRESSKWSVFGSGPILRIHGDGNSFTVVVREDAKFSDVIQMEVFNGLHPLMEEGEYPDGRVPDGLVIEDDVEYLVFSVPDGRLMHCHYIKEEDEKTYGADFLDFRPSAMRPEDVFKIPVLPSVPKMKAASAIFVEQEGSESHFVVEMEPRGDLVRRVIWAIEWD